jgi:hypothetical protein
MFRATIAQMVNSLFMSKVQSAALILALVAVAVQCQKNSARPLPTPTLLQASYGAAIGQPVLAVANGQLAGSLIRWWADSSITQWKSAKGDSAIFLFTGSGSLNIYASFAVGQGSTPYDTSNLTIQVADSLYDSYAAFCGLSWTIPFPPVEHLNLAPISFSDSVGLTLLVYTRGIYPNMPGLLLGGEYSDSTQSFEIHLDSVGYYSCCGTSLVIPATNYVYLSMPTEGNYPLNIHCNGKTFSGGLQVLGNSYAFTWNDTSLVTINPLVFNKR